MTGHAPDGSASRLLARFDELAWAGGSVEAWLGRTPPDDAPVTSACVLVTAGHRLLLVDVRSRGWDLPGGHLDPGETPRAALLRELAEEAGLQPDRLTEPQPLGWFRLPRSLMLVYRAELAGADVTLPGTTVPDEIAEVRLFPLDALPEPSASRIWFPYVAAPASLSSLSCPPPG